MSRIRECFVCGTLLATTDRQRVEARHDRDKPLVAEACQTCWWKVRGVSAVRISKNGKSYDVTVRRMQLPLFRDTARSVCTGGPTDG